MMWEREVIIAGVESFAEVSRDEYRCTREGLLRQDREGSIHFSRGKGEHACTDVSHLLLFFQ